MRRYLSSSVLVVALCSLISSMAMGAQTLFQDQMTNGAGWSSVTTGASAVNVATFGFDYSSFPSPLSALNPGAGTNPATGIPEAPNSGVGDTATSGLLMVANWGVDANDNPIGQGSGSSLAVFPTGMNFTGSYTLQFDMWLNTNGPFPDGGSGSTEHGGGSIGYNNASGSVLNGAGFHVSGEAGTTFDYRVYANGERQNYDTHIIGGSAFPIGGPTGMDPILSDLFDDKMIRQSDLDENGNARPCAFVEECGGENADGNFYVASIFSPMPAGSTDEDEGTVEPPVEQLAAFAGQVGPVKPGGPAFQWVTVKFTVDGDAGETLLQMTSTDTGLTADIATFNFTNTYVNASNTTPILTSFDGNISLVLRDLFDSLPAPGNDRLNFAIFDNVLVTAPDAGVAGDFNENGVVDAADYTVWLDNLGSAAALANDDGLGTPVGQAHYDLWKANFGNSLGTSNSSSVPEPTSLLLAALAAVGMLVRRRR